MHYQIRQKMLQYAFKLFKFSRGFSAVFAFIQTVSAVRAVLSPGSSENDAFARIII